MFGERFVAVIDALRGKLASAKTVNAEIDSLREQLAESEDALDTALEERDEAVNEKATMEAEVEGYLTQLEELVAPTSEDEEAEAPAEEETPVEEAPSV